MHLENELFRYYFIICLLPWKQQCYLSKQTGLTFIVLSDKCFLSKNYEASLSPHTLEKKTVVSHLKVLEGSLPCSIKNGVLSLQIIYLKKCGISKLQLVQFDRHLLRLTSWFVEMVRHFWWWSSSFGCL